MELRQISIGCGDAGGEHQTGLRDYGGYATRSGARLRRGVLFRSGQLDSAGQEESGLLHRLGIGAIIDMRGPAEIGEARSPAYEGFSGEILLASSEGSIMPHATTGLVAITSVEDVGNQMAEVYRRLPYCGRFRESFANYLRALDSADISTRSATLIHCFAGKDRTGLAVALFHLIAGVHPDDVFADYLTTNDMGEDRIELSRPEFERRSGGDAPEWLFRALNAGHADYLAAALRQIGDVHSYAAETSGYSPRRLIEIGERWLD